DDLVTGVQTCALPISLLRGAGAGGLARALLGLLLRLEILAGLLVDDFHRQAHLAAVVEPEELDLDLVALLDDVGHLLHPPRRESSEGRRVGKECSARL